MKCFNEQRFNRKLIIRKEFSCYDSERVLCQLNLDSVSITIQ